MAYGKQRSRKSSPDESGESDDKPKQSAKSYVIWLLSRREYSVSELRKKMKLRGYEEPEISEALEFVQAHNFQSDERFARVKTQSGAARLGNRRLVQTLKNNGINAEVIGEQLENVEPENDRAIRVAERFRGKPLTTQMYAKVQRFLLYRGFGSGAIKAAMAFLRENVDQSAEDNGTEELESLADD
jgi:regulatory protein